MATRLALLDVLGDEPLLDIASRGPGVLHGGVGVPHLRRRRWSAVNVCSEDALQMRAGRRGSEVCVCVVFLGRGTLYSIDPFGRSRELTMPFTGAWTWKTLPGGAQE